MYLEAVPDILNGHALVTRISPALDGSGPAVGATLPHHSAWRVILLGDTPGALIESNVITDLNPPNRIVDNGWIHPGKLRGIGGAAISIPKGNLPTPPGTWSTT
jgi:alpha-glucosidase